MDYTKLLKYNNKIKLGVVGASQGFGYTTLVQSKDVDQIAVRAVSSVDTKESYNALVEIGFDENKIVVCHSIDEIEATNEDDIIVVSDYQLILDTGITSVIEATGNIDIGTYISENALVNGINVYMASKETDSFAGTYFSQLARENDTIYAMVNGDQPRNLVDLYSLGQLLGLNIIAAGKSSEYDFVWDRETGKVTYTDGQNKYYDAPELKDAWEYKGVDTLKERFKSLEDHTKTIAADICEMNTVSNATGLLPSSPALNYPIAKINELADILIPKEDGGILDETGVVDVFYQLREKNEASFAGGVFIIFEIHNEKLINLLRSKGHVISENGKYGCLFHPYHMLGLEAPLSVILGEQLKIGTREGTRQVSVMVGVAEEEIKKGHTFKVFGHHHEIEGVTPRLLKLDNAENAVPFYLLNDVTLNKNVKKGEVITIEDVKSGLTETETYKVYQKGLNIT